MTRVPSLPSKGCEENCPGVRDDILFRRMSCLLSCNGRNLVKVVWRRTSNRTLMVDNKLVDLMIGEGRIPGVE